MRKLFLAVLLAALVVLLTPATRANTGNGDSLTASVLHGEITATGHYGCTIGHQQNEEVEWLCHGFLEQLAGRIGDGSSGDTATGFLSDTVSKLAASIPLRHVNVITEPQKGVIDSEDNGGREVIVTLVKGFTTSNTGDKLAVYIAGVEHNVGSRYYVALLTVDTTVEDANDADPNWVVPAMQQFAKTLEFKK